MQEQGSASHTWAGLAELKEALMLNFEQAEARGIQEELENVKG